VFCGEIRSTLCCLLSRFDRPWCFAVVSNWLVVFRPDSTALGVLRGDSITRCSFPTSFQPALKFLANFLVMFILISLCFVCSKLFYPEREC
jgi:hypothetical protein